MSALVSKSFDIFVLERIDRNELTQFHGSITILHLDKEYGTYKLMYYLYMTDFHLVDEIQRHSWKLLNNF